MITVFGHFEEEGRGGEAPASCILVRFESGKSGGSAEYIICGGVKPSSISLEPGQISQSYCIVSGSVVTEGNILVVIEGDCK